MAEQASLFQAIVSEASRTPTGKIPAFMAAGETRGIGFRPVRELPELTRLLPVPRTPDRIRGVIAPRDRFIPVFPRCAGP